MRIAHVVVPVVYAMREVADGSVRLAQVAQLHGWWSVRHTRPQALAHQLYADWATVPPEVVHRHTRTRRMRETVAVSRTSLSALSATYHAAGVAAKGGSPSSSSPVFTLSNGRQDAGRAEVPRITRPRVCRGLATSGNTVRLVISYLTVSNTVARQQPRQALQRRVTGRVSSSPVSSTYPCAGCTRAPCSSSRVQSGP